MYYRIFSKIYERAALKMCRDCRSFIPAGCRILDLGCGSGIVGKNFQKYFKAELVGADIKDNRIFPLDFQIIDGKNLPFTTHSFDVVLINYVLHHAKERSWLLKEAKRVARDKIIIYEDLAEGIFSGFFCKLHGVSYNFLFQKNKESGEFLNYENWKNLFDKSGLKLVFEKRAGNFPVKKQMFVLGA